MKKATMIAIVLFVVLALPARAGDKEKQLEAQLNAIYPINTTFTVYIGNLSLEGSTGRLVKKNLVDENGNIYGKNTLMDGLMGEIMNIPNGTAVSLVSIKVQRDEVVFRVSVNIRGAQLKADLGFTAMKRVAGGSIDEVRKMIEKTLVPSATRTTQAR